MRPVVGLRVVATAVIACLLASCSAVGDLLASEPDRGPWTAKIVVLVPQEGKQAAAGAGVLGAVQLAVEETAPAVSGWTIQVVAADDSIDATGAAEGLTEDQDVIAVVGGLSDRMVRSVQPVLARASILFVSPADVTPENTRGSDPAAPLRPYASYFRTAVVGGDAVRTAADYAVVGLGAHKVAVVDGGAGEDATQFADEARRLGAEVVAAAPAGEEGAGIVAVVAAADAARAEAIYAAGDAAIAAEVAKQLAGTGLDARLVGGVALRSEDFVDVAGTAADGAVAVVAPSLRPNDATVPAELAARLAQRGIDSPGPFAAAAYDAGTALAEVLSRCLPPEGAAAAARARCVAEMGEVSFAGVTGEVVFDSYGDRVGSRPQVYEVRDGSWTEVGTA